MRMIHSTVTVAVIYHITILTMAVHLIITQHFQVHLMKLRSTRNTKEDLQRKQHALFFQAVLFGAIAGFGYVWC